MLVQWQNYGRNILIQARMSQSPQIIHEALDETRRMGLVSLLEWKVCTSHPLCCETLTLSCRKRSAIFNPSTWILVSGLNSSDQSGIGKFDICCFSYDSVAISICIRATRPNCACIGSRMVIARTAKSAATLRTAKMTSLSLAIKHVLLVPLRQRLALLLHSLLRFQLPLSRRYRPTCMYGLCASLPGNYKCV